VHIFGRDDVSVFQQLKAWGLIEDNRLKRSCPSSMTGLPIDQVKILVEAAWAEGHDGHVGELVCQVETSDLAEGLQRLLLRLGIQSRIIEDSFSGSSYYVKINSAPDRRRFVRLLDIPCDRDPTDRVQHIVSMDFDDRSFPSELVDHIDTSREYDGRSLTGDGLDRLSTIDPDLTRHLENDVSWDVITSIEYVGDKMTYDLSVPKHHSFVADGFITHNTTFALNWAWKAATVLRYNVYYYSLEMPYEQIRRIVYALHSNHPKFKKKNYDPLDYRAIRDGVHDDGTPISEHEKMVFREVIDDFRSHQGKEYGSFIVERPSDGEGTIPEIKQRPEMAHRQTPIDMVVIDYSGLVSPSSNTRDFYTGMNSIMREAKQMALNFNQGEGVGLCLLHQINRDGKEYADKNDGRYRLTDLADANEAERSSDVVTYTYLNDDLRDADEVKVGCLKNRDNPHFDQFRGSVHFPSRFMGYSEDHRSSQDNVNPDDVLEEAGADLG
jgi:hypothetical protein